jgi:hypothetical protein
MDKKKVKIDFKHWSYTCADGCCTNYGMLTYVNGEELPLQNEDVETVVEQILIALGYDVEVETIYENEDAYEE